MEPKESEKSPKKKIENTHYYYFHTRSIVKYKLLDIDYSRYFNIFYFESI